MNPLKGGGISTGGGSLDFGQQSSSAGPFKNDSAFEIGDFNFKSSVFKTEQLVLVGLILLAGLYIWKK